MEIFTPNFSEIQEKMEEIQGGLFHVFKHFTPNGRVFKI